MPAMLLVVAASKDLKIIVKVVCALRVSAKDRRRRCNGLLSL